jgi:peroxiredoxin
VIAKGDRFPQFKYKDRKAGEFVNVNFNQEIKGQKVVVFGLPGAFTPTCSTQQLPGFDELFSKFREVGIDNIYCHAVNDPFVMNAWFEHQNITWIRPLPDGNGDLAVQLGMMVQKKNLNFGSRCWRYALILDGSTGEVLDVFPEDGFGDNIETDPYEKSRPEAVLKWAMANLSEG